MIQLIAFILNGVGLIITFSWVFGIPSLDYAAQGAILAFVMLFNIYALRNAQAAHLDTLRIARYTIDALTAALKATSVALEDISGKYCKLYEAHHGKTDHVQRQRS